MRREDVMPQGMDGSRVQLPSGRWLHQLTHLAQLTVDELAWVVAHYMLSHADAGVFRGSVPQAIRMTWPDQPPHPQQSHVARTLRRYGFVPHQDPGGPFTWRVPDHLPAWEPAGSRSGDTGEQTTGGPVTVRQLRAVKAGPRVVWTKTMLALAAAVHADPARHPRDYAAQLGWSNVRVSSVGTSLKRAGIIVVRGKTEAARYYPTDVELPRKARRYRPAPRAEQVPAAPEAGPVDSAATPPPAPPPTTPPAFPVDEELSQLGSILHMAKGLSPPSRAWLIARLKAEEVG